MKVLFDAPQRVPVKVWDGDGAVPFEPDAFTQTRNLAQMPFVHKHVAMMPDAHVGIGSTVGTVVATVGAIIPAAVGVDIGCGMMAQKTTLRAEDLPDSLLTLRSAIEKSVPHGRSDNGGANDRGAWGDVPAQVSRTWTDGVAAGLAFVREQAGSKFDRWKPEMVIRQLGTLGTGNHFIEVCVDTEGAVWVMLHSGSRGIGNAIGKFYIQAARKEMQRWMINLPDADLAYLPDGTDLFRDYVGAVGWAQSYAALNREIMMEATLLAIESTLCVSVGAKDVAVNCHHNYVSRESHFGKNVLVTRKGAVRAREGELGIIPGSMGARSFIVRGKGNPESFDSCSHGAGRGMSRTAAKKAFTLEDLAEQTTGVECRKDADVIDEIPKAYKRIEDVMAAQADLVDVVAELKQVLCVKG